MRFHEYETMQSTLSDGSHPKTPPKTFFMPYLNEFEQDRQKDGSTSNERHLFYRIASCEIRWRDDRRPFYNVYPSVIKSISNTKLSFRTSDIGFYISPVAICFPDGNEPEIAGRKVSSVLFAFARNKLEVARWIVSTIGIDEPESEMLPVLMFRAVFKDSKEPRDLAVASPNSPEFRDSLISDYADTETRSIWSLCIGVCMLAKDERFAKHILLARDAGKSFANDEQRNAAIERARNRGRNGIAIGEDIEVSPHVRRPHFGIRWTQKGRSVPRLVPVNGCLVSRSKLYPIPTGYLDDKEGSDLQTGGDQ